MSAESAATPSAATPSAPSGAVLRPVTPSASVLLAPNPSPMTLEGTNTWLLRGPDAAETEGYIVIDAGPSDESHLAAVAALGKIDLILLTHGHVDHSGGSARLAELTGAPVYALDTTFGAPLVGGDTIRQSGVQLDIIATPGHSADSMSFYLPGDNAVLTGDTILGRGTTVVAWPDGELGPYLQSLQALREFGDAAVLPGHGPELPSAGRVAEYYLTHREERLAQVSKAVGDGARTPREVVEIVYIDVDETLWGPAELSVRAQLAYLVERNPSLADQLDLTPTPENEFFARMADAIRVSTEPPG